MKKINKIIAISTLLLLASCNNANNTSFNSSTNSNSSSSNANISSSSSNKDKPSNGLPSIYDGSEAKDYDGNKNETGDQFDFDGNYVAPELNIDGKKDDKQWENSSSVLTFGSQNQAKVQLYRGETALFCFFEVEDEDIETVGNNNGDDVTKGDSVEIYFDFKNDGSAKPQSDDIQINIGAHGKTRIFVGSNGSWGSWNGLLDYTIFLDGTLNNDKDVDNGYTMELMIPYAQVGIDKNSTFGVSLGHVARGRDSTSDSLPYTWGGITFDGSFVDPQNPGAYMVFYKNEFYSRGNVPMNEINVQGKIVDQKGKPVSGAKVSLGNEEATTDAAGKYVISKFNPNNNVDLIIEKNGFKTYSKEITSVELKAAINGVLNLDYVLIDESVHETIKIKGTVANPSEGSIFGASIKAGNNETISSISGEFEIEVEIDNDLELVVSKENYKTSVTTLSAISLIGKTNIDVGKVALFSPSSSFSFGGARGITSCEAEVYRGFEGIYFTFKTPNAVIGGDHIELFIDSGISFHGRDSSDYRIDFRGDGTFAIVNFGNGTNNVSSTSGITNNAYLKGTTYFMDAFIPYSFLGITNEDLIGISAGVWSESLKDWDGWNYAGDGFDNYVAPEYSDQYCRIGLDNGLYRALDNNTFATKIYGKVVDGTGNSIIGATINSHELDENGNYALWFINGTSGTLTVMANGYLTETADISSLDTDGNAKRFDFTLTKAEAVISGKCNVEGAKVYYRDDETNFTYIQNGTYSLTVPTTSNAYIVFEKEGYKTVTKGIGKAALVESSKNNNPYIYDCVMEEN